MNNADTVMKGDTGAPKTETFEIKVVEDDPITGEPIRSTKDVTIDELITMAQQAHRFNDKMSKYKQTLEREARQRAQEMIEPEVERRMSEAMSQMPKSSTSSPSAPSAVNEDDPFGLLGGDASGSGEHGDPRDKIIKELYEKVSAIEKEKKLETERLKLRDTLVKAYKTQAGIAIEQYPELDQQTLYEFIELAAPDPMRVPQIAKFLVEASKKNISIDKLNPEDRKRVISKLHERANAPTIPAGGSDQSHFQPVAQTAPVTREGILEESLALLDAMTKSGAI